MCQEQNSNKDTTSAQTQTNNQTQQHVLSHSQQESSLERKVSDSATSSNPPNIKLSLEFITGLSTHELQQQQSLHSPVTPTRTPLEFVHTSYVNQSSQEFERLPPIRCNSYQPSQPFAPIHVGDEAEPEPESHLKSLKRKRNQSHFWKTVMTDELSENEYQDSEEQLKEVDGCIKKARTASYSEQEINCSSAVDKIDTTGMFTPVTPVGSLTTPRNWTEEKCEIYPSQGIRSGVDENGANNGENSNGNNINGESSSCSPASSSLDAFATIATGVNICIRSTGVDVATNNQKGLHKKRPRTPEAIDNTNEISGMNMINKSNSQVDKVAYTQPLLPPLDSVVNNNTVSNRRRLAPLEEENMVRRNGSRMVKRFPCNRCGLSFQQKGGLKNHIRAVHEGERPFQCPREGCNQRFGASGDVTRHVASVHERQRPFQCPICNVWLCRKSVLKRHAANHHPNVRIPELEYDQRRVAKRDNCKR